MPRNIYNEGRVIGYSAYEIYVKEHLSEDPDTNPATEREWLASSLTSGSSLLFKFRVTKESQNHKNDEDWMYQIELPSGTRLGAANTIVGSFFRGSADADTAGWAKRVINYGDLIVNDSSLTDTVSSKDNVSDWSDDNKLALEQYVKIIDGVVLQPGQWKDSGLPRPIKDLSPDITEHPIIRLHIRGPITHEFYILFTGFTIRTVLSGSAGLDGSTQTNMPADGDFLGPAVYPWANKIIFSVPTSYISYFVSNLYSRKINPKLTCWDKTFAAEDWTGTGKFVKGEDKVYNDVNFDVVNKNKFDLGNSFNASMTYSLRTYNGNLFSGDIGYGYIRIGNMELRIESTKIIRKDGGYHIGGQTVKLYKYNADDKTIKLIKSGNQFEPKTQDHYMSSYRYIIDFSQGNIQVTRTSLIDSIPYVTLEVSAAELGDYDFRDIEIGLGSTETWKGQAISNLNIFSRSLPTQDTEYKLVNDASIIDMQTSDPGEYYKTNNTNAPEVIDVDNFYSARGKIAVLTVYQRSDKYPPALWGTYLRSEGVNYLNPIDVVAPGTIKMFENASESDLINYQDTFPGTTGMSKNADGTVNVLNSERKLVPMAEVTHKDIEIDGSATGDNRAQAVVTQTGNNTEISLSLGQGGTDIQYKISAAPKDIMSASNSNLQWADMLAALVADKAIDILGDRLKSMKDTLIKSESADADGCPYIEFGPEDAKKRFYISSEEPKGDIPEGSIGIGWGLPTN